MSATATTIKTPYFATTSPDYRITYGYTALGNIASTSAFGTYSYQGNLGSTYANPHAVTTIASTTYAYDSNGNLASTSASLTNTWDYNNRLTQEVVGATTTTYLYDHQGSRVKYGNGSTTTYYFNKFYNVTGVTTVKNIFAGDRLIATIKNPSTPVVNYVHADHLGSPTILTNASSTIVETTDYNPYGSVRFDANSVNANSQRKYIGENYDADTSLSYLNARYYDGSRGGFLSEDPIFRGVGGGGFDQRLLKDPQQLNSYSYARDNPMVYFDPDGSVSVYFTGLYNNPSDLNQINQNVLSQSLNYNFLPTLSNTYRHEDIAGALSFIETAKESNPLEPVNITGHSLGGGSALELAAQLEKQGIKVNGLFLLDPVILPGSSKARTVSGNVISGGVYYSEGGFPWTVNLTSSSNFTVQTVSNTTHTNVDNFQKSSAPQSIANNIASSEHLNSIQRQINTIREQVSSIQSQVSSLLSR